MTEYCTIELTQGRIVCVSPEDWDEISSHKWCAKREINTHYAVRRGPKLGAKPGKLIYMHRVICPPSEGMVVDHINGDGGDNRRSNLRVVTPGQNSLNRRGRRHSASGAKGVHREEKKWVAAIGIDGVRIKLGYYDSIEDAHAAYCEAAHRLHGEFARTA